MKTPDSHALEDNFRRMSDGEVLQLAGDVESLTDDARTALGAELRARHLEQALKDDILTPPLRRPEETVPAQGGPKRSAAMTATGVILILFSASLLFVLISTLFVLARHGFPPQMWRSDPRRFRSLINFESQAILVGWGIATAIGILRLRSSARVSGLVICSLAAYVGCGVSLSGLVILPNALQRYGTQIAISSIGFTLLYLGIGGLAALGAIFLNSESAEQQFVRGTPIPSGSRSAAVTCISIWLVGAWPLVLALNLLNVHPSTLLLPSIPFATLFTGWEGTAFQYVVACLSLTLGVGLLRMKPWARTGALVLCAAAILSALSVPLKPNITAVGAVVKGMSVSRLAVAVLSVWDASPAVVAAWVLLQEAPSSKPVKVSR